VALRFQIAKDVLRSCPVGRPEWSKGCQPSLTSLRPHLFTGGRPVALSSDISCEHVTLIAPGAASRQSRGIRSTLPPDLLQQVRARVRSPSARFREYYADTGMLPNLTWVPIIILFPLVLPAPTRLMLGAAIAAGAMQPVAVFLLDWWGKVPAGADAYVNMTPGSAIAVGLAYMGARVVYGWGKGCGGA
jgi:hypothetical protein